MSNQYRNKTPPSVRSPQKKGRNARRDGRDDGKEDLDAFIKYYTEFVDDSFSATTASGLKVYVCNQIPSAAKYYPDCEFIWNKFDEPSNFVHRMRLLVSDIGIEMHEFHILSHDGHKYYDLHCYEMKFKTLALTFSKFRVNAFPRVLKKYQESFYTPVISAIPVSDGAGSDTETVAASVSSGRGLVGVGGVQPVGTQVAEVRAVVDDEIVLNPDFIRPRSDSLRTPIPHISPGIVINNPSSVCSDTLDSVSVNSFSGLSVTTAQVGSVAVQNFVDVRKILLGKAQMNVDSDNLITYDKTRGRRMFEKLFFCSSCKVPDAVWCGLRHNHGELIRSADVVWEKENIQFPRVPIEEVMAAFGIRGDAYTSVIKRMLLESKLVIDDIKDDLRGIKATLGSFPVEIMCSWTRIQLCSEKKIERVYEVKSQFLRSAIFLYTQWLFCAVNTTKAESIACSQTMESLKRWMVVSSSKIVMLEKILKGLTVDIRRPESFRLCGVCLC
jgi:hypothetical protein